MFALLAQSRMSHESQQTKPIIDCHQHDTPTGESLAIKLFLITEAAHKSTAMNPEGHWQLGISLTRSRCPYVQVKTILTSHRIALLIKLLDIINSLSGWITAMIPIRLDRGRAKLIRLQNTHPRDNRLRRFPTQIAHRRRRIRNTFI